jgi:hypothetical protein
VLNNPVHECTGTGKALVCAGSRKEFEEWRRRTGSKGVVYATLKSRAVRNLKPAEWTVVTTSTFWNTPDRGLIMDELERLGFDVARFKL